MQDGGVGEQRDGGQPRDGTGQRMGMAHHEASA
jgi:hypothetical protein